MVKEESEKATVLEVIQDLGFYEVIEDDLGQGVFEFKVLEARDFSHCYDQIGQHDQVLLNCLQGTADIAQFNDPEVMGDFLVVQSLDVFEDFLELDVINKHINGDFDGFGVEVGLEIFGFNFVEFGALQLQRVLDEFVQNAVFALVEHFELVSFHVVELIDKLDFALERVFICVVQFSELMGVIKLDFLDVNFFQNHVIDNKFESNFDSLLGQVVRVADVFFFAFEEPAVSVEDGPDVTEVFELEGVLFAFLVPEVMMDKFDLVFDFNALLNVLFNF